LSRLEGGIVFELGWRRLAVSGGAALMLIGSSLPAAPAVAAAPISGHTLPANTRFYVPPPPSGSVAQIVDLLKHRDVKDAFLIGDMITTPQAVWLNGGTPAQVKKSAQQAVFGAAIQKAVPVFVAYNIPGRDCANFSAGGAANLAAYEAWIDGVAAGIGTSKAVVIVEPDGLGLLPSLCPPPTPPATYPFTDADRYAELNYAVDKLELNPNVSVFLDGTHTAWLNVGDASTRLVTAGVQRAQGFFLNVSNFQFSANLAQYGKWISDCIAYATLVVPGDYGSCPNQYWNGGPLPSLDAQLFGEWNGVALDDYSQWSDTSTVQADQTSAINQRYTNMLGSVVPTTTFVIDSSRNAVGPWLPPSPYTAAQAQDWCNPPNRGLGLTPTANTGSALLAAYLWIKTPGQSDGQCNRWNPAGGIDPVRNMMDPAAGAWFPQLALELAKNAKPPLWLPKGVK
jgi:endoglucanase